MDVRKSYPALRFAVPLFLVFLFGFLAARLDRSAEPALAQAKPAGNGDINADGDINVADAVGLLNYLFLAGPAPDPLEQRCSQPITALVVRHAEKEATGNDPCLTTDGKTRADHLREYLARTAIQAVFSTEACRTIETVQPLAQSRALEVRKIVQVPDQAAALRALPSGSVALVAGHSFTIPDLLRTLGVAPPVSVAGDEYDNLWVVQFGPTPDTAASMVHLRY